MNNFQFSRFMSLVGEGVTLLLLLAIAMGAVIAIVAIIFHYPLTVLVSLIALGCAMYVQHRWDIITWLWHL